MLYAETIINLRARAVDRLFTYEVPESLAGSVGSGSIVSVPFGNRTETAFVVRISGERPVDGSISLRRINGVISETAAWQKEMQSLIIWLHEYYGCTLIEAVNTVLPASFSISGGAVRMGAGLKTGTIIRVLDRDPSVISKTATRQMSVFNAILSSGADAVRRTGDMPMEALRALEKRGLISIELVQEEARGGTGAGPRVEGDGPELTGEQSAALSRIRELMDSGRPSGALLFGVTGSGKTIVYMEAISHALKTGKNAVVLVPELSLTAQFTSLYRRRFGDDVAILHSGLAAGERAAEWRRLMRGEARIALGARSAIFAPLENIGVIIIDEEHEGAYKQDSSPRYHARHVAVKRAAANSCLLLLGSATPSLESYSRASFGGYELLSLTKRASGNAPEMKVIDMRKPWNRNGDSMFSPFLAKCVAATVREGRQALLFINRRGFFNYLFCEDCGKIMRCPNCDISLRHHSNPPLLRCHYCGYSRRPDDVCPTCGGIRIKASGGGTQRIEDEIERVAPGARTLRMDRDSVSRGRGAEEIYRAFRNGEADILVGTQMIAKGFDFPNVSLSAVVLADTSFSMPDFRSPEKTLQLLMQVGGRAGRHLDKSLFVIQTYDPEHPAIKTALSGDFKSFCKRELIERREFGYPPYNHLVRIVFQSESLEDCAEHAKRFAEMYECGENETKTGPAACPIGRIRNTYRIQLNIKCRNVPSVTAKYNRITEALKSRTVHSYIDPDSCSFL